MIKVTEFQDLVEAEIRYVIDISESKIDGKIKPPYSSISAKTKRGLWDSKTRTKVLGEFGWLSEILGARIERSYKQNSVPRLGDIQTRSNEWDMELNHAGTVITGVLPPDKSLPDAVRDLFAKR